MADADGPEECGVGIRGVAMGIDSTVWFLLFIVAVTIVGFATGQTEIGANGVDTDLEGTPGTVGLFLWLGLAIGYHTILEWRFGKTIGKYLVGIRVIADDGTPVSLRASSTRNVLRIVDWLPAFYAVAIVAILVSKRRGRLGDRLGGTAVVRT